MADTFARDHGFTSPKSGEDFYQEYIKFCQPSGRIRYPNESKRKALGLIKDIKAILSSLNDIERQQAESEILKIETNLVTSL